MTTARRIELAEYGHETAHFTQVQAQILNESKALTLTPADQGAWDIQAAQYVGVVQANGIEVRIKPKVPLSRLLFMAAYPLHPSGWHNLAAVLGTAADPVGAIAHAFCHHAEAALRQGQLQGYRTIEEALPVVRGRLREGDQLRRRFGMNLPVEVTYDDFTPDIPENRLLLSAARQLLRLARVLPETRRRLRRLTRQLANVTPLMPGESIPSVRIDRRNHRYEHGVALARLVLEQIALEDADRSHVATSFLFDMNKVFEDFVTAAFVTAARGSDVHVGPQHLAYLDVAHTVKLRPDLVWFAGPDPVAVADLKYKSTDAKAQPNADIYQLLAYCTGLGLRTGHLIYAAGNETPIRRVVRNASIAIVTWTLPLDQEPAELLATVARLGERIVRWEGLGAAAVIRPLSVAENVS